jgi:hypothetical protein
MDKLILKQPSEKLRQKLDGIVKHIRNCATLVDEVIALGKEEGFSEKQIGRMIREKLKQLGYDPRSIRRVLPSSIKDLSKTRKDYLHKSEDNNNYNMDEDILSSSENSNDFDENHRFTSSETVQELQAKFPSDCDQVFKLQNYVFLVEFKGTKVLDISVITLEQAYDQRKD